MNEKFPELLEFNVNGVSFKMVRVDGLKNAPLPFYIGQTLVTQALWKAVFPDDDLCRFKGDDLPVDSVIYTDCLYFLQEINDLTGKNFRFPTIMEWKFAAKGGTKSMGYRFAGGNTLAKVGWCRANSNGKTHPVAQKRPNELGLYDMSGSVLEWTQEGYLYGGSIFHGNEESLWFSGQCYTKGSMQLTGLRLALSPEESA